MLVSAHVWALLIINVIDMISHLDYVMGARP